MRIKLLLLCSLILMFLPSCEKEERIVTNYYHEDLVSCENPISKEEFQQAMNINLKEDVGYDYVSVKVDNGSYVDFYANALVLKKGNFSEMSFSIKNESRFSSIIELFQVGNVTFRSLMKANNISFYENPYSFKVDDNLSYEVIFDNSFLVQEINIFYDDVTKNVEFCYFNEGDLANKSSEVDKRTYLDSTYVTLKNKKKDNSKVTVNFEGKHMLIDQKPPYDIPYLDLTIPGAPVYGDTCAEIEYSLSVSSYYEAAWYKYKHKKTIKKDKNFDYFYFKDALEPFTDFDNAYTYCVTDEYLSFLPKETSWAISMTYSIKPFAVSVRSEKINFDVEYDKYGIIKKSYIEILSTKTTYTIKCRYR